MASLISQLKYPKQTEKGGGAGATARAHRNRHRSSRTMQQALIASDSQPFSIVEDKGFRSFTQALNPMYVPPSRKTLSKNDSKTV